MRLLPALLALLLLAAPLAARAQDHGGHGPAAAGELTVSDAWVRATLPNQTTAAAYLRIANAGAAADRLLSAASPAAGRVEIHSMAVVDDVMVMRPVPAGLEVPAGGAVALAPGAGFHIMLMEVGAPVREGGEVPLTLTFERAGALDLMLPVRPAGGGGHEGHGG